MSSRSLLDFLNESPSMTGGKHSSHRRHNSDPFASTLAPMSDADVAAFLDAEGGDGFLPGSLFSFGDDDLDVGDLALPSPPGAAPPFWPSPRTPGRKHRRTTSEPIAGGFFAMPPVAADVHAADRARRAPHPLLADDAGDGAADDDDDDLDALDAFPLDIGGDPGALDLGREPAPPPPPPPPSPASRRKSRARARVSEEKKHKKYRCSRCGQIKANHVCPFLATDAVAAGVQADPRVPVTLAGERTLVARPRRISVS